MQVPVHIDLETFCHTVRVQRDMAQDELIHKHTNTMQLLETNFTILFIPKDVVVATNQDLATV
jgi:hypothetical protein